jgi:hypothetical protein
MSFEYQAYGGEVAKILALDGAGERLMPLAFPKCSSTAARDAIRRASARALFPHARAPEAAQAGLYLYFSCFDEAHEVAQSIETRDGSYWHAIVHRQEPDAGNSSYWFRRVGNHAIFPALHEEAARILAANSQASPRLPDRWDPFWFVDLCERVRTHASAVAQAAGEIQRAEWQLLFHYCAAPAVAR